MLASIGPRWAPEIEDWTVDGGKGQFLGKRAAIGPPADCLAPQVALVVVDGEDFLFEAADLSVVVQATPGAADEGGRAVVP